MTRGQPDRRIPLATSAWIGALSVGLLVSIQFWIYPWVYERTMPVGEAAVSPAMWLVIDYLFPVWLFSTELGFLTLAVTAWATWRVVVRRTELLTSKFARALFISGSILSSLGAIVLAVLLLPSAFALVTRPLLCETATFQEAVSPNGRYTAIVAEVDCGAMSGFNRQVLLVRRPFRWAPASLLYFRQHPALHLSWSGRTLMISGDRTLGSMDRRPPDLMIWGGVLARYSGPKE